MNDLRLILLGIGLIIIIGIYLWGTFSQKSKDRSQLRKVTSFKRSQVDDEEYPSLDDADMANEQTLEELDAFLAEPGNAEVNFSDFSLTKNINKESNDDSSKDQAFNISTDVTSTEENLSKAEEESAETHNELIITLLIKANPGSEFSGRDILKATKQSGMVFGDMDIFHYYASESLVTEPAVFSLASMFEPGCFNIEAMDSFETKGLALFMQLPVSIDHLLAFDLMQETAMTLAESLQGEIWTSKNKPVDEKSIASIREQIASFS